MKDFLTESERVVFGIHVSAGRFSRMTFDEFLKEAAGFLDINWRKYRRRASRKHVDERLRELGLPDYRAYLELLRTDTEEARSLPDRMRVTVSRFFRERECWLELERVLPELMQGCGETRRPLYAWSAGCCNGEEPYSLAMTLLLISGNIEKAGNEPPPSCSPAGFDILATDIDEQVLARAREGCYEESALREVPGDLRERFFFPSGKKSCVNHEVKRTVRFRMHNLMKDAPPLRVDLILCRYLAFTYNRGSLRRQAAIRLHDALAPSGGLLMIGRKERLGPGEADLFEPWPGSRAIYRRKDWDRFARPPGAASGHPGSGRQSRRGDPSKVRP